jgi:hypothetical protein
MSAAKGRSTFKGRRSNKEEEEKEEEEEEEELSPQNNK